MNQKPTPEQSLPTHKCALYMTHISIRDYFAAKALPECVRQCWAEWTMPKAAEESARFAYEIADAMLARRAKP